jgi:hypothetical protein
VDVRQQVGDLSLGDFLSQPFGQRRLPHAGIAHEIRVVLAPAAEHLHGTLDFRLAADEGIEFPLFGQADQIGGVHLQRVALAPTLIAARARSRLLLALLEGVLGDLVGDVVQHIEPGDALRAQEVLAWESFSRKMDARISLTDTSALSARRMAHRALDHSLEPDGLLQHVFIVLEIFSIFSSKLPGLRMFRRCRRGSQRSRFTWSYSRAKGCARR